MKQQMKRVGGRQIIDALANRSVRAGRSGRALGLDSEGAAVQDVDVKNKPLGRINKSNLWKCRLFFPTSANVSDPDPYVDLLRRGNYPCSNGSTSAGITSPGELAYFQDVHFAEANPMRLSSILFSGIDATVIQGMEIAIVRRTPFGETIDERISLSSYYNASDNQLNIVRVPVDCEIDGSTFIRVYYTPDSTTAKSVTCTFAFSQIAERRSALLKGG